jgi:ParB family chromosome partitioning protein
VAKKALGKGIDALLSTNISNEESAKDVTEISIDLCDTNPDQPRKHFDQEALSELADSILSQGIIQPIIVEKKNDRFIIVAGERRYRAAKLAGLRKIPVLVKSLTEEQRMEFALIENIQREDLNPIEEANAYRQLMEAIQLNQEDLAKKVGKKRSTIANSLRLLKLPDSIQVYIEDGRLSAGHARAILSLVNPSEQLLLCKKIVDEGLSVREAEKEANGFNDGKRAGKKTIPKSNKSVDPELRSISEQLMLKFGTKVELNGSAEKGKIEIQYFSMDDLQRILDLLS